MHILDILAISAIGVAALAYLYHMVKTMRKNKCATLCSGCSTGSCSTKNFANVDSSSHASARQSDTSTKQYARHEMGHVFRIVPVK